MMAGSTRFVRLRLQARPESSIVADTMSHVLTLVSSTPDKPLTDSHIKEVLGIAAYYNLEKTGKPVWLSKKKAADIPLSDKPGIALSAHLRETLDPAKIDLFVTDAENRRKKLLLADMDSTIVQGETLDELAAHAGLQDKISEITQAAMEGKLDFQAALRERVALLKGLGMEALERTLEETRLNEGAGTLVKVMAGAGATCVLVSGGFTFFTGPIAEKAGFHHHHGNILETDGKALSGTVTEPILDRHAKVDFLNRYSADLGLEKYDTLTIGDGANDIPMLKSAGLGIGYRPKNAVAEAIGNLIVYGDLRAALYAQGYTDKEIKKLS